MVWRAGQPSVPGRDGRRACLLLVSLRWAGPGDTIRVGVGAARALGRGTRRKLRLGPRQDRSGRAGGALHGVARGDFPQDGAADPSPSVELDRGAGGFAGNASLEYRLARALERHVPGPDPRRGGVATGLARDEKAAPFSPASRDAPGVGVLR